MSTRAKAIVTLVLIAPVLTEIVSGNTPPHALLHPSIAGFLVAAYSLPLLVIRELSVRWKLRTPGIFLLGLAYGLLNEGLLAQTLIRYQHVPVANFDHYLYAAGINFSWVALIVPWHALMAVLFPIALLGFWFPSVSKSQWLGSKSFAALSAIVAGGVVFLGLVRVPRFQMHAFLLAMIALVGCARLCSTDGLFARRSRMRRSSAFVFGAGLYLAQFLSATILAARRAEAGVYFFFVPLVLLGFGWIARRYEFERLPDAAMVAMGAYFVASVFNCLAGIRHHSREGILCGAILSATFLVLWRFSRAETRVEPSLAGEPDF